MRFSTAKRSKSPTYPMKPTTETAEKVDETPSPPAHLSKKMKKFWISIFQCKILKSHETLIFLKACEAYDRAEQARRVIKDKGLTFLDRFNSPRTRPEVAIERDRSRCVREAIGNDSSV